jgi:hypothetical protein
MLYSKRMLEVDFEGLDFWDAIESTIFLNEGVGHMGLAEVVRFHLKKDESS